MKTGKRLPLSRYCDLYTIFSWMKSINIVRSYNDVVPHSYIENYRYGRVGVIGEDGKPFSDFIDAIEMKNVNLTIKEVKCYGNRL